MYMYICLKDVGISVVVICYAGDVIRYDRRTWDLSNALLHM